MAAVVPEADAEEEDARASVRRPQERGTAEQTTRRKRRQQKEA